MNIPIPNPSVETINAMLKDFDFSAIRLPGVAELRVQYAPTEGFTTPGFGEHRARIVTYLQWGRHGFSQPYQPVQELYFVSSAIRLGAPDFRSLLHTAYYEVIEMANASILKEGQNVLYAQLRWLPDPPRAVIRPAESHLAVKLTHLPEADCCGRLMFLYAYELPHNPDYP